MDRRKMDIRVVKYFLLATGLILGIRYFDVLLGGAGNLWGIAAPLIAGCVMAYVLNLPMRWFEKKYFPNSGKAIVKKTRRPVCIVLSILAVALIAYAILRVVVPELVNAVVLIGQAVPALVEDSMDWLAQNLEGFPKTAEELENLQIDWNALGDTVWQYLKSGLSGVLNSTVSIVSSVVGGTIHFVISLIFSVYLLSSKEKLGRQAKALVHAYVKPEWIARGKKIVKTADQTFSSFIVGQVTEAVILGSLCTLGMWIFRFPYAPMIGAFIGATALIPVVGAYLGGAVGVIMIMTQDPLKAVLFVVFLVVLQQLEGNLIYPKVVGSSIGLPGMWVLTAVTLGGGLLGVSGMLIGVPVAATLYKLLRDDVKMRTGTLPESGGAAQKAAERPAQEAASTEANVSRRKKRR